MSDLMFYLLAGICLVSSFFFSGSETGVLTADTIMLHHKVRKGSRGATRVLRLLERKDLILATMLVGNNLVNISISALTTNYLNQQFGSHAPLLAIFIVTPVILLFGEILPKALYLTHGNSLLLATHWLITFLTIIFRPLTEVAMIVPRVLAPVNSRRDNDLTREDLQVLVRTGTLARDVSKDERVMIGRLLEMKDRRVVKAMMPIGEVVMIPDTAKIRDAHRVIRIHGISRLPVYRDRSDSIVGILLVTDLLTSTDPLEPVTRYLRKPYFVPEQKVIFQMLEESYREQEIAIVIDEYGLATGIITMEDMVEEIMGDILDEYDEEPPLSFQLKSGSHVIDSRMSIKEFNETIHPLLPPGDYMTLGGFLSTKMQKIPHAGDVFDYGSLRFVILDAVPQRIGKVVIHLHQSGNRDDSDGIQSQM